ncbi:hypothetical protein Tco_0791596 [Tanacetum coccineum]
MGKSFSQLSKEEKWWMMPDSIDEGPLVYPTVVGEDGQTRPKKYSELTEAQQLQDDSSKTVGPGKFTVTMFSLMVVELSFLNKEPNFKCELGHRLKHYFGGDIPPMVVPDLQTFPMDN